MKNISSAAKFYAALGTLVLFAALVLFMAGISPQARANGFTITAKDNATGNNANHASTTPAYLTANAASTTISILTANANAQTVNLLAVASSTATVYRFNIQYSYNGIDWYYYETIATSSATIGTFPGPQLYTWNPNTTAATLISVNLPYIPAKYEQILYSTTGANGSLYLQSVLQNQTPN